MALLRDQNKQKKTISLPILPPLAISFNPSYSHPSALSVLLDVVLVLTTLRRQRKIVEGRKEGVEMLMLRRLRPSTSRVASTRHSIPSILYPSFHHSPPKKGTKLLQPNAWLLFAPTWSLQCVSDRSVFALILESAAAAGVMRNQEPLVHPATSGPRLTSGRPGAWQRVKTTAIFCGAWLPPLHHHHLNTYVCWLILLREKNLPHHKNQHLWLPS